MIPSCQNFKVGAKARYKPCGKQSDKKWQCRQHRWTNYFISSKNLNLKWSVSLNIRNCACNLNQNTFLLLSRTVSLEKQLIMIDQPVIRKLFRLSKKHLCNGICTDCVTCVINSAITKKNVGNENKTAGRIAFAEKFRCNPNMRKR